ncbi:hypothetical protein PCE1_001043 [Barthelona sp. PCE]
MKVVCIGASACGPRAASRFARAVDNADVTIIEKRSYITPATCGLPYLIASDRVPLLTMTPVGVERTPMWLKKAKMVDTLMEHEVVSIDRQNMKLQVKNLKEGNVFEMDYDKLVIATGSRPFVPPIEGADLKGVHVVKGYEEAHPLVEHLKSVPEEEKETYPVVVVGAGLIGMEMASEFYEMGFRNITIVEGMDQILTMMDKDMELLVRRHVKSKGVKIHLNTFCKGFEGEDGVVKRIKLGEENTIDASLVIMSVGVRPNDAIAKECGITCHAKGGILVDEFCRTSDPNIYAGGDVALVTNIITGEQVYAPLGSVSNRAGHVIGSHLTGQDEKMTGVLGSAVCKVFDFCCCRTGLSEKEAERRGVAYTVVLSPGPDRVWFMKGMKPLFTKLIVENESRMLIGFSTVGPSSNGVKHVDVAVMAMTMKATIDQVAMADFCYSPPFSKAMDNLAVACNIAKNILENRVKVVRNLEVKKMLDEEKDFVFLDVRTPGERKMMRIPQADHIILGQLHTRHEELPRDKPIIIFCKVSARAYQAQTMLRRYGFDNVIVMMGGILMWPFEIKRGE